MRANLILAIYPYYRGFAYAYFEGPSSPVNFGFKRAAAKGRCTKATDEVKKLIDMHRPELILIEDTSNGSPRRTAMIRKLYRSICHLAASEVVDVEHIRFTDVLRCFDEAGANTKYEIAKTIAVQIPAFEQVLPRQRQAWMPQDQRQNLFMAVALILTYHWKQHR